MKKRIRAFLLALVMLFTTVAATLGDVSVFKADQLVIKLHYNRPDGNYTDWDVWFWTSTSSGGDYYDKNFSGGDEDLDDDNIHLETSYNGIICVKR